MGCAAAGADARGSRIAVQGLSSAARSAIDPMPTPLLKFSAVVLLTAGAFFAGRGLDSVDAQGRPGPQPRTPPPPTGTPPDGAIPPVLVYGEEGGVERVGDRSEVWQLEREHHAAVLADVSTGGADQQGVGGCVQCLVGRVAQSGLDFRITGGGQQGPQHRELEGGAGGLAAVVRGNGDVGLAALLCQTCLRSYHDLSGSRDLPGSRPT